MQQVKFVSLAKKQASVAGGPMSRALELVLVRTDRSISTPDMPHSYLNCSQILPRELPAVACQSQTEIGAVDPLSLAVRWIMICVDMCAMNVVV